MPPLEVELPEEDRPCPPARSRSRCGPPRGPVTRSARRREPARRGRRVTSAPRRAAAGSAARSGRTRPRPSRRRRPGRTTPTDRAATGRAARRSRPSSRRSPSLIAPASTDENSKSCAKWIAWPYSWRITSPSSASSTPPLPRRISSLWVVANELSIAVLVDPEPLRLVVDRRQRAAASEAEELDVLLRLGDPVVRHHLLELVLAAVEQERVRRRVGRVPGLADDHGPVTAQEARAVEVRQAHRPVRGLERRVVGVLLVGEAPGCRGPEPGSARRRAPHR